MTDTDTALCHECSIPVEMPKLCHLNPFMAFQPVPLCKTCILRIRVATFKTRHLFNQPYKTPAWRPTHHECTIADDASRANVQASREEVA